MSGRSKDAPLTYAHDDFSGCPKCDGGGKRAIRMIGGWGCPCACHIDYLVCQNCGKVGPDVTEGCDPYAADVEGRDVPVVWCEDCYQERADDI